MSGAILMWITEGIYNVAIITLLNILFKQIEMKSVLQEKQMPQDSPHSDNTSYSRVSGIIGAIVLSCFFWAIGTTLIYKAFSAIKDIATIVTDVWPFLLAGSALFAPYAFNQLTRVFKV